MSDLCNRPQPTPAALGYRMPAEWFPHESTWMVWPKNHITWPDQIHQIQEIYLRMLALLTAGERVDLLVDDAQTQNSVRARLQSTGVAADRIVFHQIRTVDSWIRDYGPNFLLRESTEEVQLAFNHWKFNAWGNKYPDLKADAVIPEKLEPILGAPRFVPVQVLESGSIEVNGKGVCLATKQCLLNRNRNPHCSQSEIEKSLRDYLGVHQILWLGEGIEGDDTDGHVDDIARFVNPQTIVYAFEEDPTDENYAPLQENYRRLQTARDLNGRSFELIPLPMPGRLERPDGRLPASYANFYIANKVVLMPTFSHSNDVRALETLQKLFPQRKAVGLDCRVVVWGLGALHCLTQQQPARVSG